jgi:hypothetical protein
VRSCLFQHDQCRNTEQLKYAGQNIALTKATGPVPELVLFINSSIHDWYSEIKDARQSDMDKYQSSNRVIGHMTQVVNDLSNEVGCAIIHFADSEWNTSIILCNYARTNIMNFPIYESGPAASKCTTGKNKKFEALCSVNEPVDPNAVEIEIDE